MDKYLYYCENCDKLFKLSNRGKKIKCTKCGGKLKDLDITSSDYEALSADEKEVLKMWTTVEDTPDAGDPQNRSDASAAMVSAPVVMGSVPAAETEDISPDMLFGGTGNSEAEDTGLDSLFDFTDSDSPEPSGLEALLQGGVSSTSAADEDYGQDDTGLDSGSEPGLDFLFGNDGGDSGSPAASSDEGEGSGAGDEEDDFASFFESNDSGSNSDIDGSNESAAGGVTDSGSSGGSSLFGDTGSSSGSSLFGDTESSTASGSGGGFSFFGSMGVDKGSISAPRSSGSPAGGSSGGSGSSFFDGAGSGTLYDNMSASSYSETPAVSGGTMYSRTTASVSSSMDDAAMSMLYKLSWMFCLAPFVLSSLNAMLFRMGIKMGNVVSLAVYIGIMAFDSHLMKPMGKRIGVGWKILGVVLFPPAYLFRKANVLDQKKTPAIVSLVLFLLGVLLIVLIVALIGAAAFMGM